MTRTGYEDIAALFRHRIQEGDLGPGDLMPSMREVAEDHGVTITTVNRAYRLLKTEGLTFAKPGVGTIVSARRQQVTGAGRLERLARTGKPYARGETSARHTSGLTQPPDRRTADLLGVNSDDEIWVRTRVFVRDETSAVFARSCIHPRALPVVPELREQGPMPRFWQELYTERTGKTITRSPEQRGARLAYDYELEALEIETPPNAAVPVLVLHNSFSDEDGPIEAWEDVYRPGLWQADAGDNATGQDAGTPAA